MAIYSIKDIEKITGIKAHTIRMWERRYGMVIPKRTDTNIRYYSDQNLKDILNISILNQNGLKISKIAELSDEELRTQVSSLIDNPKEFTHIIDKMLLSMLEIDEQAFSNIFSESLKEFGFEKMMELIFFPFLERIGILWQTGTINPAQEHFISNLLRQKIIATIDNEMSNTKPHRDKIIFFLPEGEMHELGLLFYSFIARKNGFEVIYLGASVPTSDLIEIQRITNAKAMFSAYVSATVKEDLEEMFNHFSDTFPALHFYVTGLQIKELNPKLPPKFYVISSSEVFKNELKKLKDINEG